MATEPTVMKMRLAEINQFVLGLQKNSDPYTPLGSWERGYEYAEVQISKKLREIMGRLPKGYVRGEKSLKTKAKGRYLLWRANQAKADWKKLTPEEQAVWEGYIEDGLEFGTIREKELERAKPIMVGDRVEIVKEIWFLGSQYRIGMVGEVSSIKHYDGTGAVEGYALTFNGAGLSPVNAYPHEIKKASSA